MLRINRYKTRTNRDTSRIIYPLSIDGIRRIHLDTGLWIFEYGSGKRAIEGEFDWAGNFNDNGFAIVEKDGKVLKIDVHGNFFEVISGVRIAD